MSRSPLCGSSRRGRGGDRLEIQCEDLNMPIGAHFCRGRFHQRELGCRKVHRRAGEVWREAGSIFSGACIPRRAGEV